jgi:S1-C subfamily serine protease
MKNIRSRRTGIATPVRHVTDRRRRARAGSRTAALGAALVTALALSAPHALARLPDAGARPAGTLTALTSTSEPARPATAADGTAPQGLDSLRGLDWAALERAVQSVVAVRSEAVEGARSARTLGQQREGSGVVIGVDGLVLTIGYLVLEADTVSIEDADGRQVPARVVAQDIATGLALVQSLVPLGVPPVELGAVQRPGSGEPVLVASGGEDGRASVAQLLSRRPFSGNWEYHLDEALYTAPARRDHSGAALFNLRGQLVGIGSLMLQNAAADGQPRTAGNLFVPAELLLPVLGEWRQRGQATLSTRAWLGINCTERDGQLWVVRVAEDSPAERAGLVIGDRIVAVDGRPVMALEALWKALWSGQPEREVRLTVQRQGGVETVPVQTVDRAGALKRAAGV